jgi:protein-S-isoprenylcysteine O-methyltransferase Ste14
MRSDYLVLALLWATYCGIHSALISTGAVNFFNRVLGNRFSFYRLFFNAFSLVTLVPLVFFSRSPRYRGPMLFAWSGNWRIVQYLLIVAAAVLLITGARHYSLSRFLGLHQVRSHQSRSALTESGEFDATGVLSVVRHPWYVAVFILLWASDLSAGTIVINIVLSAYLVIGTLLEERKLLLEFGDKYREYQQNVSMFIPLKWLNQKHK